MKPLKETLYRWLWPNVFRNLDTFVAKAKQAISSYGNAVGEPVGLAGLMAFYGETAARFWSDIGSQWVCVRPISSSAIVISIDGTANSIDMSAGTWLPLRSLQAIHCSMPSMRNVDRTWTISGVDREVSDIILRNNRANLWFFIKEEKNDAAKQAYQIIGDSSGDTDSLMMVRVRPSQRPKFCEVIFAGAGLTAG